jgi:hypothetical protein
VKLPVVLVVVAMVAGTVAAQSTTPSLRVGTLPATIAIDGQLTEVAWQSADAIERVAGDLRALGTPRARAASESREPWT